MMIVRLSQPTLKDAVAQTLERCAAEGLDHFSPIDPARLYPNWSGFLECGDGFAYALMDGEKAAGVMLALKTFDMLTNERQMLEFLWLVAPSARKTGAAVKLLDVLEQDAKQAGCVRIICGADQRHAPKAMEKFYKRRGYEPRVFTYGKKL